MSFNDAPWWMIESVICVLRNKDAPRKDVAKPADTTYHDADF
jgi:hypothetical protein